MNNCRSTYGSTNIADNAHAILGDVTNVYPVQYFIFTSDEALSAMNHRINLHGEISRGDFKRIRLQSWADQTTIQHDFIMPSPAWSTTADQGGFLCGSELQHDTDRGKSQARSAVDAMTTSERSQSEQELNEEESQRSLPTMDEVQFSESETSNTQQSDYGSSRSRSLSRSMTRPSRKDKAVRNTLALLKDFVWGLPHPSEHLSLGPQRPRERYVRT